MKNTIMKRNNCFGLVTFLLVIFVVAHAYAGIDEIAIFNEVVAWTTVDAAQAATDQIIENVKTARNIKIVNRTEVANFIAKTSNDRTIDALILFGYLPETVYAPGNSQEEDSLIEKFIEGGNIVMNTADYIFYVSADGGSNGENGLKTITDSNFDCWGVDDDVFKPTADGKKYMPSLPAEYNAPRPIKKSQIDADENWEVEISFGATDDGERHDPIVVKNKKTGGRFVIVRQTEEETLDRGAVFSEIIDNYFGLTINLTENYLSTDGPEGNESPSVGNKFSVFFSIVTPADLHHFTMNLSFDPSVLRAENIEYGDFLNAGKNGLTTNSTPVIDNDVGLVTSISARRNTNTGINGSGNLMKINFEAVGEGSTKLQIQNPEFAESKDQPLVFDEISTTTITVFPVRGQIAGAVTSSSGKPIADARVEASLNGQQVGNSVQTNYQGEYLVDQIYQAGLTTVKVSVPGALPIPKTEVEVIMGQRTKAVDFQTIPETALQSVTDSQGFIRNWLLLGPIWWEKDDTRLRTNQLSPKAKPDALVPVQETEFREIDPKDGDSGTGLAQNLRWSLHVDQRRREGWEWGSQRIRPNDLYGQDDDNYLVYAHTHVKAEEDMKVTMQLEHHGVVVWLNGELVHLEPEFRCCVYNKQEYQSFKSDRRMEEITKLELQKGWNSILIKAGRYDFSCRFATSGSVLGQAIPLTNLPVSPQLGAATASIDQPVSLARGAFNLELEKGLNMISLPVKPDQPMTSKTLAKELDATLVIRLDSKDKTFVPFVPEHFEGSNFTIEGDMGLIVNVKRSQTSTFTGTVWDNTNAAPIVPIDPQSVWAFGLIFDNLPTDSALTVRNLRSGQTIQSLTGTPAIAFVDQSQQSVVRPQDWIEVEAKDTRWRYQVTGKDLRQAFAVVTLNERIQIPNQTRLLQNYPNPFNPETWMPIELSQDTEVSVTIYDVQGKQIRQLQLGMVTAGRYVTADQAVYWDGKTETGETVSSGTYFYQLRTGDYTETRKMVILK